MPLIETLSDELLKAKKTAQPVAPLSARYPALSIEEAYSISRRVFQKRARPAIGKKIGLTSYAVQKQLGVGQPDFGFLTDDMKFESGASCEVGQWILPKAEGEVVFLLGKDLSGKTRFDDVVAATAAIYPAIEIIDSRIENWKIKIQDTIADNASSAAFVLGAAVKLADPQALRMAGMTLKKNGEVESTGVGAACLDHPVNAVVWLANLMSELDEPLKKGDLILSGAFGPVIPVTKGDRVEVSIYGLGEVRCSFV